MLFSTQRARDFSQKLPVYLYCSNGIDPARITQVLILRGAALISLMPDVAIWSSQVLDAFTREPTTANLLFKKEKRKSFACQGVAVEPVLPTNTTSTAANLMIGLARVTYLLVRASSSYADVAEKISTILPLVSKLRPRENRTVNKATKNSRIAMLTMKYSTIIDATGKSDATAVPITTVKCPIPSWEYSTVLPWYAAESGFLIWLSNVSQDKLRQTSLTLKNRPMILWYHRTSIVLEILVNQLSLILGRIANSSLGWLFSQI